jgi:putative hydrolase of the HAD superfamily
MSTTIVFDLDDTLYLERDYARSGIRAVDAWARRSLGLGELGTTATRLWNAGRRDRLFDAALAELGIRADRSTIAEMVSVYREHEPDIRLAPDAHDFLASDHDYALALISDGFSVAQHRKVDALDLARFGFDPIICTGDWGREFWKPHRRAFETVEAAHRGASNRFVYVADNPAKDFLAPRALGWATVQIDRPDAVHSRTPPSDGHRADTIIRSLHELTPARVEQLFDRVPPGVPA